MSFESLVRLGLLYAHLILCAFAICYVLSADLRILKGNIPRDELARTAHRMTLLLAALWATGLPVVMIDLGGDITLLLSKAKLVTKLLCVTVLSLNAVVLHKFAFPHLMSGRQLSQGSWRVVMCSGAVSTVSWMFAAFLGIAKPLASVLSLSQFLGLYAVVLLGAVGASLALATPVRRRFFAPGGALAA